jgi:hypothetical protein
LKATVKHNRKSVLAVEPQAAPLIGFELTPPNGKVGRRPGRHSSPDFQQCSVWLSKRTRLAVDLALSELALREGKKKQFSTLVEELLFGWLESHNEITETADES